MDCGTACDIAFAAGSTVTLTAGADSASAFGSWSGACTGTDQSCRLTIDGRLDVGATFDAATHLEENGAGTSFGWGEETDPRAFGRSYRWEHRAGASVTFGFEGPVVTLFTIAGPAMGRARVSIDGTPVTVINGFAPSLRFGVEDRFSSLGSGAHTMTVTATGTHGSKATGTRVGVDALRWEGELNKDPRTISGTWASIADSSAGGGTYAVSDVAGATTSLRFTGTGATWITLRGPAMGRAEIWVDGTLRRTVDLYAPSAVFGVQRSVSGLADTLHLMTVVVVDRHRPSATGSTVAVDGWIIR
jgi:hypothetical protein